jgi:hypothetical protein
MHQHTKRDVHSFSEPWRQSKLIQRGMLPILGTPLTSIANHMSYRSRGRAPQKSQVGLPSDPKESAEYDRCPSTKARGRKPFSSPRDLRQTCQIPYHSFQWYKVFFGSCHILMQYSESTRPPEGTNTRHKLSPTLLVSKDNYIPGFDIINMYDSHLWNRIQNSRNEFEELKEHLRCVKTLLFNWLVIIYHLVLFVAWYSIVSTSFFTFWPGFHCLKTSFARTFVDKVAIPIITLPAKAVAFLR